MEKPNSAIAEKDDPGNEKDKIQVKDKDESAPITRPKLYSPQPLLISIRRNSPQRTSLKTPKPESLFDEEEQEEQEDPSLPPLLEAEEARRTAARQMTIFESHSMQPMAVAAAAAFGLPAAVRPLGPYCVYPDAIDPPTVNSAGQQNGESENNNNSPTTTIAAALKQRKKKKKKKNERKYCYCQYCPAYPELPTLVSMTTWYHHNPGGNVTSLERKLAWEKLRAEVDNSGRAGANGKEGEGSEVTVEMKTEGLKRKREEKKGTPTVVEMKKLPERAGDADTSYGEDERGEEVLEEAKDEETDKDKDAFEYAAKRRKKEMKDPRSKHSQWAKSVLCWAAI